MSEWRWTGPCTEWIARATPDGISYELWLWGLPEGEQGWQSYEEILERGGLQDMPLEIEAEARAYAKEVLASSRPRLRWQLRIPDLPADDRLAYVRAKVGAHWIATERDEAKLWEGSLGATSVRLELELGFGRERLVPRAVRQEVDIPLRPGVTTEVTCIVAPDFTIMTETRDAAR